MTNQISCVVPLSVLENVEYGMVLFLKHCLLFYTKQKQKADEELFVFVLTACSQMDGSTCILSVPAHQDTKSECAYIIQVICDD